MTVLSHVTLPAQLEFLQEFIQAVSSCAKKQGFSTKKVQEIELATEEALVNVFKYSYPEGTGDVEVVCTLEGSTLMVDIIDSGIPFDVTSVPDPDINADISDRKIGGLGIFFIKKLMDDVRYRRENNKNILTLVMKKEHS
ncbi:MAG: ATP-binding protein [Proteobacteria bacterium]|nr:ATP-binding protein [Pseudomonadota bacterium]